MSGLHLSVNPVDLLSCSLVVMVDIKRMVENALFPQLATKDCFSSVLKLCGHSPLLSSMDIQVFSHCLVHEGNFSDVFMFFPSAA